AKKSRTISAPFQNLKLLLTSAAMRRIPPLLAALAVVVLGVLGSAASAQAHEERQTRELDGTGSVPVYRTSGPTLLVCKTDKTDFENRISKFSDMLRNAPKVKVYTEFPILTLDQEIACPNLINLVAVINKKNLQIEGTGASREDVVLDGQFKKLNGLRVDNSDGIYLKNFTAQRTEFNAVYIIETDGFVIDNMLGRWNDEYGFLTFAVDHGLYTDCEGYGNGDSAFYPG